MSVRGPWEPRPDRLLRAETPGVRSSWLTYETFYGLKEKPFGLSSDPAFFYHSHSHAPAYDDLFAGIRRRESLSVLIGDIGTGKTTLCRSVLANLDHKTFSAFVTDPFASREDLLKIVLVDFRVVSPEEVAGGKLKGLTRTDLSFMLYNFLGSLAPLQAFAVVVVDEAQNLSLPLLEEIRILSDSDGRERHLQVVLVGQLELRQKLALPEMRQVDQRITVRCNLGPLSRDSAEGYISHRLHVAGASTDRIKFAPEALDYIHEISGGVPRMINRICDRALHTGYQKRAHVIDKSMVESSLVGIDDLEPLAAPAVSAAEPVDQWLTVLGGATTAMTEPPPEVVTTTKPLAFPREPVPEEAERVPMVPRTHLQKLTRRWLRRGAIVSGWAAGIASVVLGLGYVVALSLVPGRLQRAPDYPPPVALKIPARIRPVPVPMISALPPSTTRFVIEAARFNEPARALRVVNDLAQFGFRAYLNAVERGDGSAYHQVLIGPYVDTAEAGIDLQRLRHVPGYTGARALQVDGLTR